MRGEVVVEQAGGEGEVWSEPGAGVQEGDGESGGPLGPCQVTEAAVLQGERGEVPLRRGEQSTCQACQVKECNDRKNGYHGFTRKCSGVPLRKCSQVSRATATTLQVEEEEKCEEIEDTQCSLVPGQVQGNLEP